MKGFVAAEMGHLVNIIPPIDITGGANGQAFSMKKYQHATILVQVGVSAAAFTKIIVNACTDAAASNPTALAYSVYKQETAGASHDVLGARTAVTSAGLTPSANDNIFYVIELDAAELPDGSPYVQVQLTNTTNSVIASAVAILSGARFAETQSPTEAA
jgi:hypothetical protein